MEKDSNPQPMTKEDIFAKAYGCEWGRIKDKIDCEGWMHSMYFKPVDFGLPLSDVDRLIFVDVWRPKVLGWYDAGYKLAKEEFKL